MIPDRMTWGEFKKILESQGVSDDMPILYIDVNDPSNVSITISGLGIIVTDLETN